MDFNEACARVREGQIRPGGIGILQEKPLHATLKWWVDDNPDHHEITLPCGKVADVYDGERVYEIQTGGFSPLRPKLEVLLPHYPVTVVHPIPRRKYLSWITPDTGETTPPRKRPRVGTFTDGLRQLIYIRPLFGAPQPDGAVGADGCGGATHSGRLGSGRQTGQPSGGDAAADAGGFPDPVPPRGLRRPDSVGAIGGVYRHPVRQGRPPAGTQTARRAEGTAELRHPHPRKGGEGVCVSKKKSVSFSE